MTVVSTFYDTIPGKGVNELEWAVSAPSRGALYGVDGEDDLRLTAHPATANMVILSPGQLWGQGVWDIVTEPVNVQCVAPAAGVTRWDLICARRDWQATGGGPTAFVAVQGVSTLSIPSGRNATPGEIDDQPLWAVRWTGGQSQPTQIIDLRCWAGNGGMIAASTLALGYLARPGADVLIGGTTYRYAPGANDAWGWVDRTGNGPWVDLILGTTAGVPGVRTSGAWVRVGSAPAQARLVAGGTLIQVRGELSYSNPGTPSYTPAEGWAAASLPASMAVSDATFITGTSDTYRKSQMYVVNPNRQITLGPGFAGLIAQFNGIAPS